MTMMTMMKTRWWLTSKRASQQTGSHADLLSPLHRYKPHVPGDERRVQEMGSLRVFVRVAAEQLSWRHVNTSLKNGDDDTVQEAKWCGRRWREKGKNRSLISTYQWFYWLLISLNTTACTRQWRHNTSLRRRGEGANIDYFRWLPMPAKSAAHISGHDAFAHAHPCWGRQKRCKKKGVKTSKKIISKPKIPRGGARANERKTSWMGERFVLKGEGEGDDSCWATTLTLRHSVRPDRRWWQGKGQGQFMQAQGQ